MKTQYRKIHCGTWFWLKYLSIEKGWLFTKKKWKYVWKPYCDKVYGRGVVDYKLFICSFNDDLDACVEDYRDRHGMKVSIPSLCEVIEDVKSHHLPI